jgi:hypothetical protein
MISKIQNHHCTQISNQVEHEHFQQRHEKVHVLYIKHCIYLQVNLYVITKHKIQSIGFITF